MYFFFIKYFVSIVYSNFRSHAIEFADSGVRVNCVAPGVIFSQTARDNYAFDVFGAAIPGIPAKRLGTPEEVEIILNEYTLRFEESFYENCYQRDAIRSFSPIFRYRRQYVFCYHQELLLLMVPHYV